MRVLISNMTILLSNSNPKIPKSDIFSPKFKDFHFSTKLCNETSLKMLLSIWQYFQIPAPKYANLAFLVLNLGIFIFHRDYKYDNILSTFQPKDPNRALLDTLFFFFFFFFSFWLKLYSFTNSRVLFKNLMLK